MSDLVPNRSAKVVIGVCGDQSAGKTIFLTCIFKSIRSAVPPGHIVDFDRLEVGNANYFQNVEDDLIATGRSGPGTSTRTMFPVRMFIRSLKSLANRSPAVLSLDLFDFAGGHFRSIADLRSLAASLDDSEAEEAKTLRQVSETLREASAFVILINSTDIDPLNETPGRNPFSASVDFMLAHCEAERKPVALLFSQIDQTPRLTEEVFESLPRVIDFKERFTSDLHEFTTGGRTFGLVRRVSCFETVPGDLAPRRQTQDGSIWRPEPAKAVVELLRAVVPRVNADAEEAARLAEAAEAEKRENERAATRRRTLLRLALLVAGLLVACLLAAGLFKRAEGHQIRLLSSISDNLREGQIMAVSLGTEEQLGKLLAKYQETPGEVRRSVRIALEDVEVALGEIASSMYSEPLLETEYVGRITRLKSLASLFDAPGADSWQEVVLPGLLAREQVLSNWFGTERKEQGDRSRFLDESAIRFREAGDIRFADLLSKQSLAEKEAEVAGWRKVVDIDPDVPSRVGTIQRLMGTAFSAGDPVLAKLARRAGVAELANTLLSRRENIHFRTEVLAPLSAGLVGLAEGDLRFEVLARELLSCKGAEECSARRSVLGSAINKAEEAADDHSASIENMLRGILQDRTVDEQREIWSSLADSLASSYLFSIRPDAWPNETVGPLSDKIRRWIAPEKFSSEEPIDWVARRPIYQNELRFLGDHLETLVASRGLATSYSMALSSIERREYFVSLNHLESITEQLTTALAERSEISGPLADLSREAREVLSHAQEINAKRARQESVEQAELDRLSVLVSRKLKGRCVALGMHEPPEECGQ